MMQHAEECLGEHHVVEMNDEYIPGLLSLGAVVHCAKAPRGLPEVRPDFLIVDIPPKIKPIIKTMNKYRCLTLTTITPPMEGFEHELKLLGWRVIRMGRVVLCELDNLYFHKA